MIHYTNLADKVVNREAFRTLAEAQQAGYRLVKARDEDRYYLAQDRDLQPLLVRLGDIAEVRFGIKTGANEFFYLEPVGVTVADVLAGEAGATVRVKNGAGWQGAIETSWLRPVIKSPRELKTLRVRPEDLRYLVFMPPDEIREKLPLLAASGELRKRYPHAWAYIQWGEKQGYHKRSTCASRQRWWDVGEHSSPDLIFPCGVSDTFRVYLNAGVWIDKRLYSGFSQSSQLVGAIANCSMTNLMAELGSRTGLGQGLLDMTVYEVQGLRVLNPAALTTAQRERLLEAFEKLAEREVKSIFEELGLPKPNKAYSNIRVEEVSLERVLPDRRALDAVVFEVLGLSEPEQLAVYRAVVELVKSRLVKAQSV